MPVIRSRQLGMYLHCRVFDHARAPHRSGVWHFGEVYEQPLYRGWYRAAGQVKGRQRIWNREVLTRHAVVDGEVHQQYGNLDGGTRKEDE